MIQVRGTGILRGWWNSQYKYFPCSLQTGNLQSNEEVLLHLDLPLWKYKRKMHILINLFFFKSVTGRNVIKKYRKISKYFKAVTFSYRDFLKWSQDFSNKNAWLKNCISARNTRICIFLWLHLVCLYSFQQNLTQHKMFSFPATKIGQDIL